MQRLDKLFLKSYYLYDIYIRRLNLPWAENLLVERTLGRHMMEKVKVD